MLPKIEHPIYTIQLSSVKEPVKFRPFLSKEKRLFLMAIASGSSEEMLNSVRQVAANCIVSPKLDIESLPTFDLEYFFLQIRARSSGEKVEVVVEGRDTECENCQKQKKIEINLDDIKLKIDPDHKSLIDISHDIKIQMRYPIGKELDELIRARTTLDPTAIFDTIVNCIKTIVQGEQVFEIMKEDRKDLKEWVEALSLDDYQKLEQFVFTMPRLSHKVDVPCKKCNYVGTFVLEGIENFFM